jgi:hypothetical protein
MKLDPTLIYQITSINRAWKHAREQWGDNSSIAVMLRERKSSLQVRIIRSFPASVYLKLDTENIEGEPLYSVRLSEPVRLPNNVVRSDVEHMPVRMAEELFSADELKRLVK